MIAVALPVRTAVIGRLRGALNYDGVEVPVFGRIVPEQVEYPFVYLPTQLSVDNSCKTAFGYDHTLNVEVVYRRSDGSGSDAVDIISGQVKELLLPFHQIDEIDLGPELSLRSSVLVDENDLIERTDTFWYFRRIIRIEFSIAQTVQL